MLIATSSTEACCSGVPPALIDDSEESAISHRTTFFIQARAVTLRPACLQHGGQLPSSAQDILGEEPKKIRR